MADVVASSDRPRQGAIEVVASFDSCRASSGESGHRLAQVRTDRFGFDDPRRDGLVDGRSVTFEDAAPMD
jgi:hypothetical protein